MAIAYGSITLVDIGDLGQLSVVPESNQPSTVIYDPNAVVEQQYNPNWGTSNLVLKPVIYYGGTQLTPGTTAGLTVTWQRKVGSGEASGLTSGETAGADGNLTVKTNQFTGSTSQLTYICSVSYSDPATMGTAVLTAQGQITYSLIKNASKVKSASITGESVFLYDASSALVQTGPITLTANLNALDLVAWGYKNSSGTWTKIESTSSTLTVAADSAYFVGDIATFKLYTKDSTTGQESDVTDIHVITKIRDGLPGDQVISVILTNENQMIPCDSSGNPTTGAFNGASTTISVYEGSTDVTDDWNITYELNNVVGTWDEATNTFTATALKANVGSVNFTCTPGEDSPYNSPVYKKFNLTKIQPGVDGVTPVLYSLEVSTLVVNKNIAGLYSPSTLTVKAWSQTGTNPKEAYKGRFKIYTADASVYTSTTEESSYTYTNNGLTPLIIELYEAGGTTKLLDSQTVITVFDGQTGEPGKTGDAGKDAISFVLGNYQDVIPCTNAGYTAAAMEIEIPFAAYKGGARVACSATLSALPAGMTQKSNSSASTKADGMIVITVASGKDLGGTNTLEGKISVTLIAESVSNTQTYSWVKNVQAADGTNAILFQVYAPNGNIIVNGENNVLLSTSMVNGATPVTSGLSYQWAKWNGAIYEEISNANESTYTVQAAEVSSYTSYRCIATYGGKTYEAYLSVYDKTDPLQLYVYSTLGDKIVNSVGKGLIYVLAYRNGQEIDPMKTTSYGVAYPETASVDNFFYLLDPVTQTATLKKYTGSTWVDASDAYEATYNWTLRDSNNAVVGVKTGKAIYVDHAVVNKKTTFDVEVII